MSFKNRIIYGDFQTPVALAEQVTAVLGALGVNPRSVLEPSCGRGHFLAAAHAAFAAQRYLGVEINPKYVHVARRQLPEPEVAVVAADFFAADWPTLLTGLADPLLVLGNPPWVTTARLGVVAADNAPARNSAGFTGLEALTGRANFDISEWMLRHLIDLVRNRDATVAMLIKTSVARKLLAHMWRGANGPRDVRLYAIDAQHHFGAAVDACLFVARFPAVAHNTTCAVYSGLKQVEPITHIGYRDNEVIADIASYQRTKHLLGDAPRWRSGIKHDCSRVVELRAEGAAFRNGFGELVDLEQDYLLPMLKSSELARGASPERFMLVTQRQTSDDTARIAAVAPKTWRYLRSYREQFSRRASSIYRNRDPFAMFGVGDYSFTPWKVAVSGFYKQIAFQAVGPHRDKPVVLDDTCYLLPCVDRTQAQARAAALNSELARDFFRAHVFADNKRPVTARLLSRLNVDSLVR